MAYEPDTESLEYPSSNFEAQQRGLLNRRYSEGWVLTSSLFVHGRSTEDAKVFYFFERAIAEKKPKVEVVHHRRSGGGMGG